MSVANLGQVVRASIARAKDVALRSGEGQPAPAARPTTTVAGTGPVAKPDPTTALLREGGGPAAEALRAQANQRGGVTATVVAALGGNRYVVDVDGVQTAVVLEARGAEGSRGLTPGAEVRLVNGRDAQAAALQSAVAADDPQFSTVAKLIAAVVGDDASAGKRPGMEPARLATPSVPISPIADQAVASAQVAAGLKQAVDQSGLFYESHLAQWVAGKRALDDVQREPQAQLARATIDAKDANTPAGAAMQREAASLVREQIHALQAQQFAWQCELWRDQPGFLEIGRDPCHAGADAADQTWRARIAMHLPKLGDVEVRLAITGNELSIALVAADERTRETLVAGSAALGSSLQAQGLRPQVTAASPREP